MKAPRPLLLLTLLTLLTAACSSSKSDQPNGPVGNTADAKPNIGPYPGEPYGNAVGDTLTNLKLQGYVNEDASVISNTTPFVDSYSLEDIRATGASHALVHVSEFF
jgi:hypothetical protein